MNNYTFQEQVYKVQRYPATSNKSLQAWNTADEHLIQYLQEQDITIGSLAIYNDRFGFLTCLLQKQKPISIVHLKSQEKSIQENILNNKNSDNTIIFLNPLAKLPKTIDTCLIKIPKSLDLFKLFLQQLSDNISANATVLASFMTKYFTNQFLEIAALFFEEVEQSKAWKKSRLLILKKPKKRQLDSILHTITTNKGEVFQQYYGVFSAKHIDYASQYLIEHLQVPSSCSKALDLASGNGVLAATIRQQHQNCELHLIDDSFLAIESSKLNIKGAAVFYHYNDSLENIEDNYFDFVVSNPPFHFEHENNIDISIRLFQELCRCMTLGGQFILVANKHLNYKTHLAAIFKDCQTVSENEKYVIYKCYK